MDSKDVNTAEAASASAQDVKQAGTSSAPATDVSTAPSEPTKGDDRSELLKIAQDAVKPKDETGDKEPDEPEAKGGPAPAKPDEKPDAATQKVEDKDKDKLPEITEDEIKGYDRRSQKRIRQLIAEKKELAAKLSTLEPTATVGQEFQSFIETHKLSNEDTNLLLNVGAALKRGDFEAFLKGVMPYVQIAQEATGAKLPADLQAKVDEGMIDAELAREHARLRAAKDTLQGRVQESEQDRQAREAQDFQVAVRAAVTDWEARIRQTDPDYAAKQGTVLQFSKAIAMDKGPPRTVAEAVKLAQDAYEEANKLFGTFKAPVQPTRPSPSSGSQVATSASPEPRNLMEAALAGLRKAGT